MPLMSKKDLDKLAGRIVDLTQPKVVEPVTPVVPNGPPVTYADPMQERLEQSAVAALEAMPTGNIIVRGRRGTQMIDQSQDKVNAIQDYLQSRKNWRTTKNIR